MKRRRSGDLETITAILARGGEDRFAPKQPPIPLAIWRQAVGPRIADQAVPVSLQREGPARVLVIRASSSTWASELSMLAEPILARLRNHGLDVQRLLFRTGKLEQPFRPVERRTTREVPPPAPLPSILRRELEGVADDELRGAIAEAAARSLSFGTNVISESPRGARAPRSAGTENAPPGRTERADPEAAPRTRGGGRGRSR